MWLTRVLLSSRSTPGRIHGGKHRLVKKVTATQRASAQKRDRIMRDVESLLSMSYLSVDEERGHAAEKRKKRNRDFYLSKRKSLGPNIYAEASTSKLKEKSKTFLSHLYVSR